MSSEQESLDLHQSHRGKIATLVKTPITSKKDLSLAYTPGVAEPCRQIKRQPDLVYTYTNIGNTVAVVTDGTAVLGLGDIGPSAGLPVMEGKCVLLKEFAGVDAFPIALATTDIEEIIQTIKNIAPSFGGINLEDISAPRCFEIETRLKQELDIPVFHDDQHGTAVVVLAGLINALRVTGQNKADLKVVVNGTGAAGVAITKMLLNWGVKQIVIADSQGAICNNRDNLNSVKAELARLIGGDCRLGSLAEVIKDRDVFIGVSKGGVLTEAMVKSMNRDPIIFALANPEPEIEPELALAAGVGIIATGRSDFANQVNNVLAFPGIFKGALRVGATDITEKMKLAAAHALADYVKAPRRDQVLPDPLDKQVAEVVAEAVAQKALEQGVVRNKKSNQSPGKD